MLVNYESYEMFDRSKLRRLTSCQMRNASKEPLRNLRRTKSRPYNKIVYLYYLVFFLTTKNNGSLIVRLRYVNLAEQYNERALKINEVNPETKKN